MFQKYHKIIIGITVVILVIGGYFLFARKTNAPSINPMPSGSVESSNLPSFSPGIAPYKSGMIGKITTGPTCPVQRNPPDPQCANKPYVGTVIVYRSGSSQEVGRFTTDKEGVYKITLSPGSYYLSPTTGMPGTRTDDIVVGPKEYTDVDIVFDTGIR